MMDVLVQSVRDLWSKLLLSALNRRRVWLACVFFLTLLSWLTLYEPWDRYLNSQLKKVRNEQSIVNVLEKNHRALIRSGVILNGKFLAEISAQLKNKKFKDFPYKIQQINQTEIEINFKQVPYDTLISWMWFVSNQQQAFFKKIELKTSQASGLVQATIFMVLG